MQQGHQLPFPGCLPEEYLRSAVSCQSCNLLNAKRLLVYGLSINVKTSCGISLFFLVTIAPVVYQSRIRPCRLAHSLAIF